MRHRWTLRQGLVFEAGRHLPARKGAASAGQPWHVIVEVGVDELSPGGLVVDFDEVFETIENFDRSCLEEVSDHGGLEKKPTTEQVIETMAKLVAKTVGRPCSVEVTASNNNGNFVTLRS